MARKRAARTISIVELLASFSAEDKAIRWLEAARWGPCRTCPHCGERDNSAALKSKPHYYRCRGCRRDFSVKTDSVMHNTKIPVRTWAVAVCRILAAREGISGLQLSRELGVTRKTAWFMLQRILEACPSEFKLGKAAGVGEARGGEEPAQ